MEWETIFKPNTEVADWIELNKIFFGEHKFFVSILKTNKKFHFPDGNTFPYCVFIKICLAEIRPLNLEKMKEVTILNNKMVSFFRSSYHLISGRLSEDTFGFNELHEALEFTNSVKEYYETNFFTKVGV